MMDRTSLFVMCERWEICSASPQFSSVISMYTLFLLHRKGIRASQYFALIAWRARPKSALGRKRTRAGNSDPVTFPRMVQDATLACGLFRIRLHFPESSRDMKYILAPSSANQIGVGTATPFLRNVVRLMYFCPWISAGKTVGMLHCMPTERSWLAAMVRRNGLRIAPRRGFVLNAVHAQMDARAPAAPQEIADSQEQRTRTSSF